MSDATTALAEVTRLSRMLWEARESLEMWLDHVEAGGRIRDPYTRGLIAEIDQYRHERGWSPDGFGGETS